MRPVGGRTICSRLRGDDSSYRTIPAVATDPAPKMQLPVLIFDFGNVICHFDYSRACEPWAARLGTTGSALLQRFIDRGLTPLVARYETGGMTDREFAGAVCRLVPELGDVAFDEFAATWRGIFWLNEPVVRLVAGLRENGYRLLL